MDTVMELLGELLLQITAYDQKILKAIYDTMSHGTIGNMLDTVMPKITILGDMGIVWIILTLILLIPKKTRRTGAAMAVALLLGLIFCNGILKNVVARPRPFDMAKFTVAKENLLIPAPTDWSFPSGHTVSSTAASTALFKDHTVWGFLAFVLALTIAFSRLYLQVHYPSDVLAGLVLGFLMGLWGSNIVKRVSDFAAKRKSQKQAAAPAPTEE